MALPKYPNASEYPIMDVEDYLILDNNSKTARYEYLDGELRMLAGGSSYHSMIKVRLIAAFERLLEGGPCCVYDSDMRLQLSESRYVYPDIAVSCDPRDQELVDTIHYPRVVVEVLSPSTEFIDRGKKSLYYRECSTVQEYVIVDSQSIMIEVYHRDNGKWTITTFGPGSEVKLESLEIQFPIDSIYRGMKLGETRMSS
ncbi:MAG TPA: Uma2 family endonuclease [Ktedonobacteraceae bacterium]|jgi:Uma2 family endonuclease|nr:Uma2 family endonuclease [Ktedonobacteraceae bacterium]